MDITNKPHLVKAVEYCLNNNKPLSKGLLDIVDITYKDEVDKYRNLDDKIKYVIDNLTYGIDKIQSDRNWFLGGPLHSYTTALEEYKKEFENCLEYLKNNEKIKVSW